jgi:hypothetical protein
MQSKDELVAAIRQWVTLDNEIRALQREMSTRRTRKTELGKTLLDTMRGHTIDCVEIAGGKLLYKKRVTKRPLTRKLVDELISQYYENDLVQCERLKSFMQDHRGEVVVESIVRKETAAPATTAASASQAEVDTGVGNL